MSSRKGNFLKAVDVLDMIDDALAEEYNSRDAKVSLAATKYAFLKYKMGGNIIFDPHESVKMTGNSGPYLLYSAVRAKKILSKLGGEEADSSFSQDISRLVRSETYIPDGAEKAAQRADFPGRPAYDVEDGLVGPEKRQSASNSSERGLAKKLLEYKTILDGAVTEMAPHKVANYLYELAQDFSRFYENCPVAGSDREEQRVKLVQVFLATMTHGLNILGIEIPEEM
jgi:arginyl-tRNA synthetase